jgi:hypothetical protein
VKGHRYKPQPILASSPDGTVHARHQPRCSCGWQASQQYPDSGIAYQAWLAHRDQHRTETR